MIDFIYLFPIIDVWLSAINRKGIKSKAFRNFPRPVGLHLSPAARDNTKDDIDEKVREREKDVKVRSIK